VRERGARPFLARGPGRSYAEFDALSNRAANALGARGVVKGDRALALELRRVRRRGDRRAQVRRDPALRERRWARFVPHVFDTPIRASS
jgi:hypothetical protein